MHVILLKAQNQPMLPSDMKFVHAAALLAVLLQVSGRADALFEKEGPVAVLGGGGGDGGTEERKGPAWASGSSAPGPTTRAAAARAAGELALRALAPPSPPQLTVLGHLQRHDKMMLGSTCTSLRLASWAWFSELTVTLCRTSDVASLAAWLERHQGLLHLKVTDLYEASEAEWSDGLTALPPALVISLDMPSRLGLPAAVSTLTALTRLEIVPVCLGAIGTDDEDYFPKDISVHRLRPLTRLRQLSLVTGDLSGKAEALLSVPALSGLQALQLRDCSLSEVPRALSTLTQLTALSLNQNCVSVTAPLAALQRLQSLDFSACRFRAIPRALSALTALTRLDLTGNSELADGWQHLLPLVQLQYLILCDCDITTVPGHLAALTALTRLNLSRNTQLESGWQHLLPLTQLQDMELSSCSLAAVPKQLSALTALSSLDLINNGRLADGWQHLLPLTQLRHLRLQRCGLNDVPGQLATLTALARLDLSGNIVESGWPHLLPLNQLCLLDLSSCDLVAVPRQLSALSALTSLNLSCNYQLSGGWQHLLHSTKLQDLDLRMCGVQAVPKQLLALTALTRLDVHRSCYTMANSTWRS